jgi:voltage-gated potassium channel Kch
VAVAAHRVSSVDTLSRDGADLVLMPYRDAAVAAAGMILGRTEAPETVQRDPLGQEDFVA